MRSRTLPLLTGLLLVLLAVPAARADDGADALLGLRKALRKGEAKECIEALRRVGRLAPTLSKTQRRSAAVVVRKALEEQADAEVRAAMIHTLAQLGGTTGWVPVILAWREGRDPATKAAARQALLWGGGDFLEVVERLWREDEDSTFRAELMLLLGDRRRPDAVPLLLKALAGKDLRVRSAAAEALEAITNEAFGYDAAAWSAWWAKAGPRLLAPAPVNPSDETVTTPAEPREFQEPPPHVTRSLVPEFYGLKLTAKDIVFVLDISGSVGAGGVSRAKRELVDAIESLGSDVWITALFFDETVHMWKPEMVRATPANKGDLALFMRGIETGRKTDLFTALNAGLQIVRRRLEEHQRLGEPVREAITMIVVSDGVETARSTPPSVVAEKLDRLDPAHTVVHAVALGGKGSALLQELARRGGGFYIHAP